MWSRAVAAIIMTANSIIHILIAGLTGSQVHGAAGLQNNDLSHITRYAKRRLGDTRHARNILDASASHPSHASHAHHPYPYPHPHSHSRSNKWCKYITMRLFMPSLVFAEKCEARREKENAEAPFPSSAGRGCARPGLGMPAVLLVFHENDQARARKAKQTCDKSSFFQGGRSAVGSNTW